jgi:lipopolysaccharide biosynthesis protein
MPPHIETTPLSREKERDSPTAKSKSSSPSRLDKLRLIAFFLTQYHPTPENDRWWGKGFTEWTNVTKASPLFEAHYQPHLPTDLGFYDLRLRETRHEQIRLAKQYGIDGFCYHYYWFSGTRILNRPLDDMLADPESDMPFCLCWANENWTRRWDAAEHEILIAQKYLPGDDLSFIKSLIPFFKDPRYIKLNGAPFLVVYRPQHLPDAKKSIAVWREYCRSVGIEAIHVAAALTHGNEDYAKFGCDSGVEFPPHNHMAAPVNEQIQFSSPFSGNLMEYHAIAQSFIDRKYPQPNVFRTVFPSWDNTARAGARALVVLNGTPANYEYWLAESIRLTASRFQDQECFVFVNAWNEWAEGCHLEPDRKYRRQFLEATLKAKRRESDLVTFNDRAVVFNGEGCHRSFWWDITQVLQKHFDLVLRRAKARVKRYPWLKKSRVVRVAGRLVNAICR